MGALVAAGMLIPSRFAVTLTPSTEHRVFFLKLGPQAEELKKGDYVLFEFRSKYVDSGASHKAIKRIVCAGGEELDAVGRNFYCNGREIAVAKALSLKGEELPRFFYNGKIPTDAVFVTGQHRDSFDSRYFGFVRNTEVKAVAYPLF
jgi:signal peptidase I